MFKGTRAIGIDIGAGCVKAVALQQSGGKLHLAGTGAAALAHGEDGALPDAATLGRAIRAALDRAGVRGRVDAFCSLPRHAAATRVLTLPGEPSERLARAAVIEAVRTLPFPASEVAAGAHLHAVPESEESIAVVAAARTDAVAALRAAATAAGVNLLGLGVSSLASLFAAGGGPSEVWVLVDIGARATSLDVVAGGVARVGRVAMVGGDELTEAFAHDLSCDARTAEERKCREGLGAFAPRAADAQPPQSRATDAWCETLISEIRLLLAAHSAQGGAAPGAIALAGGGGELAGLASRLEQSLGVACAPLPLPVLEASHVERPGQFSAAHGLALMAAGRPGGVDLLASEVREERATRTRQTRRWATAMACLMLLAYGSVFAYRAVGESREGARTRAAVAREAAASQNMLRSLEQRKQSLDARAKALRASLKPETPWVAVLDDLAARAPRGVWLTGMELERGKPLVVRGTALEPSQAADLVNALSASPYLSQVQLSYANEAELNKRIVTQFGITALVRGNLAEPRATVTRKTTKPKAAAEESAL